MNTLNILGFTKDLRTDTNVIYLQISLNEYFDLIGQNYNEFQIQRRKERHRGYSRMKKDLKNGALLPGITLAIEPSKAGEFIDPVSNEDEKKVLELLKGLNESIYIIDGLQRTHLISQLIKEDVTFHPDHKLLLEVWVEPEISHLIYRLIVLNSGQKPMSLRHQIELLFTTLNVSLTNEIRGLELINEKDESSRTKPLQYNFDTIVTAYESFLNETPEIDKSSIISSKLDDDILIDKSEDFLDETYHQFVSFLKIYTELDKVNFNRYKDSDYSKFRNWFAQKNVANSFFAAIGFTFNIESRRENIEPAINSLIEILKISTREDPLDLEKYDEVKSILADPREYNVGFITRKLLTNTFTQFLREGGDRPLNKFWLDEAKALGK